MTTYLPQTELIDTLEEQFANIDALISVLANDDWSVATPCPGWDVRAILAHIVGTESQLEGESSPSEVPLAAHVRNSAGEMNERWVSSMADLSPHVMVDRYRAVTGRRIAALREMSPAEWDLEVSTPAGTDSYGRYMRIRVFDCWMHEQDIRDAIGHAGNEAGAPVDQTVDEITTAMGFIIGKQAKLPAGSSVSFELLGPAARSIYVEVNERATVVEDPGTAASVILRLPVGIFTRLCGGRIDPDDARRLVTVEGHEELGARVLEHLAYTI